MLTLQWSSVNLKKTRKSSCVNARGIPTATYEVLHPRWGTPPVGVAPWPGLMGGGYPRWGTPHRGTPQPGLMGGYLRWGTSGRGTPYPHQVWWGVPGVGYCPWQGYPPPSRGTLCQVWWGVPKVGSPHWTWLGYPPRCGQTDWWTDTCQNITFPRTAYAVGKNSIYSEQVRKSELLAIAHVQLQSLKRQQRGRII